MLYNDIIVGFTFPLFAFVDQEVCIHRALSDISRVNDLAVPLTFQPKKITFKNNIRIKQRCSNYHELMIETQEPQVVRIQVHVWL